MKIKVIASLMLGTLFYINGFNYLWALFFSASNLEVIREGGYWSFNIPMLDRISHWLHFISFLGFIGLTVATAINYTVCKKLGLSKINVFIVFVLAYFVSKPIMENFRFFHYRSELFKGGSMHVYFLVSFLLAILIGSAFLIFPLYLRYFKFANPGGTA